MRSRQSRKSKSTNNANSKTKQEKPPDMIYMAFYENNDHRIRLKKKSRIHFLTKCFLPELAQKIQSEIQCLESDRKGRQDGQYKEKSWIQKKLKEVQKEIAILRKTNNLIHSKNILKEKEAYFEGLMTSAKMHHNYY